MAADYGEFLQLMKRAAVEAVAAGKPADLCYGTVEAVEPLQIITDQKLPLYAEQLELCRAVQDYWLDVEISTQSEDKSGGGGYAEFAAHRHAVKGRKKLRVYNGLQAGERVLLLRWPGGQKFLVLDRVSPTITKGDWQ